VVPDVLLPRSRRRNTSGLLLVCARASKDAHDGMIPFVAGVLV